jgi:hypothetical protein
VRFGVTLLSQSFHSGIALVFLTRRLLSAALFLFSSGQLLLAQFPINTQKPVEDTAPSEVRTLVSNYCRLDYEGGRLDSKMWSKFQPMVWWTEPPKYTQIDVIARYVVDSEPVSRNNKYIVSVHYRLLGTYDLTNGYVPEPSGSMQNVDFLVSAENTQWRIGDAENTYPHPSRAAMLKWLNDQLATAQDPVVKEHLQSALTQIQAQPASPFAK